MWPIPSYDRVLAIVCATKGIDQTRYKNTPKWTAKQGFPFWQEGVVENFRGQRVAAFFRATGRAKSFLDILGAGLSLNHPSR